MNAFSMALFVSLLTSCGFFGDAPAPQYTVVKGDTLTGIAKRHSVTVDELLRWNRLTSDRLDVGQVIAVGPGSQDPSNEVTVAKRRGGSRSVKSGPRQPAEKPCLKGPSLDDLDDDTPDIRSSVGLTSDQIRVSLNGAMKGLARCFPSVWPDGVVDLEFTVGCNGRVSNIRVLDSTGVSDEAVRCMVNDLRRVGFPAHDMPDGMIFRYPLTLSP